MYPQIIHEIITADFAHLAWAGLTLTASFGLCAVFMPNPTKQLIAAVLAGVFGVYSAGMFGTAL